MKQRPGLALLIVVLMLMIGGLLAQLSYQGSSQLHKIIFFYERVRAQEDLLNQVLYSVVKLMSTHDVFFDHHNQEFTVTYDITALYKQICAVNTISLQSYSAPRLLLVLKSTKNRLLAPSIKVRITLYDDVVYKSTLQCLLSKIKKGDEDESRFVVSSCRFSIAG